MNKWLKDSVFYQVYPTSFYDSNGDGIGDLQGIIQKLDYIKDLGANAIWLNPFYDSPFFDGGYDVSDYYSVHKMFGTMADFEQLIAKAKELGIRVIIDLVIGHTSNQHPWFIESGKDEKNKYSDWYIWTDSNFNKYTSGQGSIHGLYPRDGGYVINYYACQPALNFGFNTPPREIDKSNPYDLGEAWQMHYKDERLKPLREELLKIMRFWLDKGVDGFRVDLANSLVKGCKFDSDKDEDIEGLIWVWNILIGTIKKEYPDAAFIAEWTCPTNSVGKCGFDLDYLAHDNQPYNDLLRNEKGTNILPAFEQGYTYFSAEGKGSVKSFIDMTEDLYAHLDGKGYFSVPSGYHDIVRMAEKKDADVIKTVFALLLTYKHVPFIYYGDEIGMTHQWGINKDGGYIRTGSRTPMQWTNGKNRGFSSADSLYLPVNDCANQSVETQESAENSIYNIVKQLLALRKSSSAFNADAKQTILSGKETAYPFMYERTDGNETYVIVIHPADVAVNVQVQGTVLLSQNCIEKENGFEFTGKSFLILKKA